MCRPEEVVSTSFHLSSVAMETASLTLPLYCTRTVLRQRKERRILGRGEESAKGKRKRGGGEIRGNFWQGGNDFKDALFRTKRCSLPPPCVSLPTPLSKSSFLTHPRSALLRYFYGKLEPLNRDLPLNSQIYGRPRKRFPLAMSWVAAKEG